MTDETFTAALTFGYNRTGVGEMVTMPLVGDQPPETLRRPVEVNGEPKWEVFNLVGNQDWAQRIANYQLVALVDRAEGDAE